MPFEIKEDEKKLFTPSIINPNSRNISLSNDQHLKGAQGSRTTLDTLTSLMTRFRKLSDELIYSIAPNYTAHLRTAPCSFRPLDVSNRKQSWRADDKRLHVDAFPSRPNYGERILRVFLNMNPNGQQRVWRIGEPFEKIAQHYLPKAKKYSTWKAKVLNDLGITKTFRSEYDHIMLQLHDLMKQDVEYQQNSDQQMLEFDPGSVWVCFSDQLAHAAMSGQFMMEQTYHLPVNHQYLPSASPLGILRLMTGKDLINKTA